MNENNRINIKKIAYSILFITFIIVASVFLFLKKDDIAYDDTYGYIGVVVLCFICNATVFAPAPSLVVAVTAAQTLNPLGVAVLGAIGTSAGELVGFLSGHVGRNIIIKENRITEWVKNKGSLGVFLFAAIPLPLFDVAGIIAGYSNMKCLRFFIVCFCGKLLKMMVYVYGSLIVGDYIEMFLN